MADDPIRDFFDNELPQRLTDQPDLATEISAVFVFDIDGAGAWTVDLTGTGEVREGADADAGCVVTTTKDHFETLLEKPSAAMMLFMSGKLKVSNVGLGMSLQKLLS